MEAIKALIIIILAPGRKPSKQPGDKSFNKH
jgi:hypothetical protein